MAKDIQRLYWPAPHFKSGQALVLNYTARPECNGAVLN